MGSWGPGIFANDPAADARADWRNGLIERADPAELSRRLIDAAGLTGGSEDTEFLTGLAAAQWETGHLQAEVRDRALALIAAGGDLLEWDSAEPSRRGLEALAAKLTGPMPKPKRLRGPRAGPDPGVEQGDMLRIYSKDRARSDLRE